MLRLALSFMLAVARRVPPSSVNELMSVAVVTAPRFPSALIASVPPLTMVPPLKVLLGLARTSVP